MNIQIRTLDGALRNEDSDLVEIIATLGDINTSKISFDFEGARLILYADGTYQIFGGRINYPHID